MMKVGCTAGVFTCDAMMLRRPHAHTTMCAISSILLAEFVQVLVRCST